MDISYLFRTGVVGWQADARSEYSNHAQGHNLQQLLVAVNSKNHKMKKPPGFDKLYPVHHKLATLNLAVQKKLAGKMGGFMAAIGRM